MFRSILAAAAVTVVLVGTACGSDGESATPTTAAESGEQIYQDYCAACHGRDFEGTSTGPSHLDPAFAPEVTTDEMYRTAIAEGVAPHRYDLGPMPAIPSLTEEQVTEVIAYIRSVQEERGVDGDAAAGTTEHDHG